MKISEIVDELNNVSEWIDGVANSTDKEQEHIKNMFKEIILANDLEFKSKTNSPTIRINNISIAGK